MKKIIAIALALVLCTCMMSMAAFATENTVTVRAQVPADWTEAYVYSWIKGGQGPTWPGDAMTKDGDWWVGTVDAANDQVIISNNGNPQTVDLTFEAGKDVWIVVTEAGADGKFDADVYSQDPAAGGEPVAPETPEEPETPAETTYIVAGVAGLCGAEWDPANQDNKMSVGSDGLYAITYQNVAAGTYSFKVTDGSWTNSWGGDGEQGNYDLTVEEAGEVTIKFDASSQKVTVLVNGVEDEAAQTGDMSLASVAVALLAATAGLVAVVSKKED